jgi:3'(2'), 5'-bisphosphate nucleotidase
MVIAVSRRHGSEKMHAYLAKIKSYELINKGSSLKSCLVAEGSADIYPRFGKTSEWDTAAAQCIVEEAGGEIFDNEFKPLRYNTKASLINPEFFVVGDPTHDWRQYLL